MAHPYSQQDLLDIESSLHPKSSADDKLAALRMLQVGHPPSVEVISAVAMTLVDSDVAIQTHAEELLTRWNTHSVRALMRVFRSTPKEDVQQRLAIIGQLRRIGRASANAEPLLVEAMKDPVLRAEAEAALTSIRGDWPRFLNSLGWSLVEAGLLYLAVLMPAIVIQSVTRKHEGISWKADMLIALLGTVALVIAKVTLGMQTIKRNETEEEARAKRIKGSVFLMLAGAGMGLLVGYLLGSDSALVNDMFK